MPGKTYITVGSSPVESSCLLIVTVSYQRLRESRWACPFRGDSLGGPAGHGRPAHKGLDEACAELCKACLPFHRSLE